MSHSTSGRCLRPAQAAQKLGIGLSTLWLRCKSPDFPKPFRQSPRVTVFFEHELDEYLATCASKRVE
jgi:prophage regulatory protein